jgi:capsular polysaccharide biosynthesis protein
VTSGAFFSPLAGRLQQLDELGLSRFYARAAGSKEVLFPAIEVPAPPPILRSFGCKQSFHKRHDGLAGVLPPSGIFRFRDCHVSKSGTLLDAGRQILVDDDLVSPYWVWFLAKLIEKVRRGRTDVAQVTIGQFINGAEVPVRHLPASEGTTVLLAKPGGAVYGHWILDMLPMVWNLFEAVRLGAVRPPLRFLLSRGSPAWARAMLAELFDIGEDRIVTFSDDEVLRLDEVVVPSLLRISPLISPRMNDFVRFVFERLAVGPEDAEGLPRRFYVTRANARGAASTDLRRLLNEDEVLGAARDAGLAPLAPETLPWRRQLALFARAEVVAGEYGSALHNTLFSPASTVSLLLVNSNSNFAQSGIAGLRGQRLVYVKPNHEEPLGTANQIGYRYEAETIRAACAAALEPFGR